MANELAVSVVIGAALQSSFNSVVNSSVAKFNKIGDTITEVEKKSAKITAFKQLRHELAETDAAYRSAKDRVASLTKEIKKSKGPNQQLSDSLADAKRNANELNSKLKHQRTALQQQRQAMKQAGLATTQLDQQERKLGQTVDKLRAKYQRLNTSMQAKEKLKNERAERRGELLDAAAIAYTISRPISAAMRFESVMADVKKVVDFDTPVQFKTMGDDILRMSTVIPMSADGLAEIMAQAGQAGIARKELRQFTRDAAMMGVAFDMSGKQSGSAMTGLRSQFKLNQGEVVLLGDAYNHLSNNMDATAADLLNISSRAGSTARLFGLTGQQVGALGATFLELKTPPEVAATGINAMLLKLATADKQGVKFRKSLEDIGFTAEEMKVAIEEDAQGALLEFLSAVKESDDVMGTLSDLFGMEYADDMAKLVGGLDNYRKALRLVGNEQDYAGSMQKEYQERAKTTDNNMQLFMGHMNRLGVTLGSVLLPPLNMVLGVAGSVIGVVADLANEFPVATQVVLGLAIGFGVMKIATIATGYAFTFVKGGALSVIGGLQTLTTVVTAVNLNMLRMNATMLVTAARARVLAVGGMISGFASTLMGLASRAIPVVITALRGLTIAVMSNPTGLVIGGIALAAGFLISNWSGVSGFFTGLWDTITAKASTAFDLFKTIFEYSPLGLLTKIWGAAFDWISNKFDGIGELVSKVKNWFGFADDEEQESQPRTRTRSVTKTDNVVQLNRYRTRRDLQKNKPVVQPETAQVIPHPAAKLQVLNQQIEQQVKQADIPLPSALTQPVNQQLNPVAVTQPSALIQQVNQRVKPADIKLPGELNQQIRQQLVTAQINQPSPLSQAINQQLNTSAILPPEMLSQQIRQQLISAKIPQPGDLTQRVIQQVETTRNIPPQVKPGAVVDLPKVDKKPVAVQPQVQGNLALQQAASAPAPQVINHNSYQISIAQQPGEDVEQLVDRMLMEIERRNGQKQRGGLYDE